MRNGDVGLVLGEVERALEHVGEAEPLAERVEELGAARLHPELRASAQGRFDAR